MPRSPEIRPSLMRSGSVGLILALSWIFLTVISVGIPLSFLPLSWQAGFAWEVDNNEMPTATYLVVQGLSLLAIAALLLRCRGNTSCRVILAFSVCLRLVAIFGEPIHESDFYRYLWDGQSAVHGVNPYAFEPGALLIRDRGATEPFLEPGSAVVWSGRAFSATEDTTLDTLDELREESRLVFDRVSHKAVPTIYPPFAQVVFAISAALFGWSILGLKAILVTFDLGAVLLILAILRKMKRSPLWAIAYAWNPLVIKEFANSAHYDSVPVFFCLLALWFALGDPRRLHTTVAVVTALALGTLAKYFAILLLPILLGSLYFGKEKSIPRFFLDRSTWIGGLSFSGIVALGFLPFALWDGVGVARLFEGLSLYRTHWQYNPAIFSVLHQTLIALGDGAAFSRAGSICTLLLVGAILLRTLAPTTRHADPAASCFFAMSALFVLSATAFPWYFCWALAFLPFVPRWSWLLLALLLPLNYLDFKTEATAPIAHWRWNGYYVLSSLIWLTFLAVWIFEKTPYKSRCLDLSNRSR